MPPTVKQGVSLTSTSDPVEGFVELDGEKFDVLKCNGEQYKTIEGWQVEDPPITVLYGMAAELCPSLPEDRLMKLNRADIGKIILLGGRGVAAVEALFPNAESPERTSTSPD